MRGDPGSQVMKHPARGASLLTRSDLGDRRLNVRGLCRWLRIHLLLKPAGLRASSSASKGNQKCLRASSQQVAQARSPSLETNRQISAAAPRRSRVSNAHATVSGWLAAFDEPLRATGQLVYSTSASFAHAFHCFQLASNSALASSSVAARL